jgi:ribosomal protein S18 acetylase RimI-like enzyme
MVDSMIRRRRAQAHMRPFNPYRDTKQIAELMALAFGGRLGADGEIALAEMRRIARWGPLLWWLYWPGWDRSGVIPGFVWVEQGRVVGNVSLRRASQWNGFFIGNVAVHPDWRRRGLATSLMEAALEVVSSKGGHWAGLEVRADNLGARQLYERLGFRKVGTTLHMLRPAGLPWTSTPIHSATLRGGRVHDGAALVELVRDMIPAQQRALLELRKQDYRPGWERTLSHWLDGRREVWWVDEESGILRGAVRVLFERGRRPDQLEILVAPGHSGHVEAVLLQRGLASLHGAPRKMVNVVLPTPTQSLVAALEASGFQTSRRLVQMRLDLVQHISPRDWEGAISV